MKSKENKENQTDIQRYHPSLENGLTESEVEKRKKDKLVNKVSKRTTKTYFEIFKTNVLTFFNIFLTIIAIFNIIAGNAQGIVAFITVMILNMIIGVIQDIRAKKLVEKLKLSTDPVVLVKRDKQIMKIPAQEVVLDDIFFLETGNQISVDAIIKEGSVEVDESVLTGEAKAIKKSVGEMVLSGSFVVSGKAILQAERISKNSFVEQIQAKAKQFKRPKSELLKSINGIFRFIAFIILPLSIALFLKDYFSSSMEGVEKFNDAIVHTSASLIGMIPAGMFLFTSMTLAVGVIRLGKKQTLVQELYSIEMLARSNVLCFDKTGTLTDGTMSVANIEVEENYKLVDIKMVIGSMLSATKDNNATALALAKVCPINDTLKPKEILPFSSKRKCSAVTFEKTGTFILGALEYVIDKPTEELKNKINEMSLKGYRVLVLAFSKHAIKKDVMPAKDKLMAIISIRDNIRPTAFKTIEWFKNNQVNIKIISGDDPITVSEIARQCGIDNYKDAINLTDMDLEDVKKVATEYTIFGRVSPEQKAAIVESLKEHGNTVAMTGDGVNDIIALKKADCSIAMASGADVAKYSSHLVLRDSDFSHMPEVVQEGRRVVNNLQSTISLFLNKTIFAFLLSLIFFVVGIVGLITGSEISFVYPFETQHLYIWEFCSIGIAGFFLAMQPNDKLIQGGFISNVVSNALPGGLIITCAALSVFVLRLFPSFSGINTQEAAVTMGMIVISVMSFVVLLRCSMPFNKYRKILFTCLSIVTTSLFAIGSVISMKEIIVINGEPLNIFKVYLDKLTPANIWLTIGIIVVFSVIYFVFYNILKKHLRLRKVDKNDKN